MTFQPPSFNLHCNVWRAGNAPPAVPDATFDCNLAWGKRVSSYQGVITSPNEPLMTLLLPVGEDVRGPQTGAADACIEVPAGTGRFYTVIGLDDIGKGFPNEHRAAILAWTTAFGNWPVPIP